MKIVDLSHVIEDNMPVYPGDIKTNLIQSRYLNVDEYNNFRLDTGMHSGTHIDSPMHLTQSMEYISQLSLESFIGPGCILDVRNQPIIKMKTEYEVQVKENSIVLLYTGQDRFYGSKVYYGDHPCVDMEFGKFLAEKNIKMLGMDMPSPDRYPFKIHNLLLENKIFIIENLTNLDKLLGKDKFEIMAFPLKIKADSSPARVVARIV